MCLFNTHGNALRKEYIQKIHCKSFIFSFCNFFDFYVLIQTFILLLFIVDIFYLLSIAVVQYVDIRILFQ